MCVQDIQAISRYGAGGTRGGIKRQRRHSVGKPWKEFYRNLVRGKGERVTRSSGEGGGVGFRRSGSCRIWYGDR